MQTLNILVKRFKHLGLASNTKKTQAIVCTLGKIRVQLLTDSYTSMCKGVAAREESKWAMLCHMCNKTLQARSLPLHLSSAHDIHQQVVVAKALLEERAGVCYRAIPGGTKESIQCPFPGCLGVLSSPYMLHRHFRGLHSKDSAEIPREGFFPWCELCTMRCNLLSTAYPLSGVYAGSRETNTARLGHYEGHGPKTAVLRQRGVTGESRYVPIFWTEPGQGRW
jgi:hypothetical protein